MKRTACRMVAVGSLIALHAIFLTGCAGSRFTERGAARGGPGARGPEGGRSSPNFIVILFDDLGWGDLRVYGNRTVKTPHIDRLAREGIVFKQFYAAAPVCSPSRAAFMTGLFPARIGFQRALANNSAVNRQHGTVDFLDPSLPTVPRLLERSGYATAHFGRWHLGRWQLGRARRAPGPTEYGIEVFFSGVRKQDGAGWKESATRAIFDRTIDFITANRANPFYVQVWLWDVHWPIEVTPEERLAYADQRGLAPHTLDYLAAITRVDEGIGRLISALEELRIAEDTLIIVSSDNGPEELLARRGSPALGSTGPLRGRKRSLHEGGIRVPFIVRWPATAPAGVENEETVLAAVDLLPTLCALAGVRPPAGMKLDGEDMSGAFRGEPTSRRGPLFWRFWLDRPRAGKPDLAMRRGDWKFLMSSVGSYGELYDLSRDIGEMENLVDQRPDLAGELAHQLRQWDASLDGKRQDPGGD